jgi:hypothetical protein
MLVGDEEIDAGVAKDRLDSRNQHKVVGAKQLDQISSFESGAGD